MSEVYSSLRWINGTCAVRICRACYLKLSKVQRHPDFSGPALLDFNPLHPGERCHDCNTILKA